MPHKKSLLSPRYLTAGCVLGGVLFIYSLSAATILLFGAHDAPKEKELLIPEGTAQQTSTGQMPLSLPSSLRFRVGDILVLQNQDRVTHKLGQWTVQPGETRRILLDRPAGSSFLCSFHTEGELGIEVATGVDLQRALIPALFLGLPLGLGAAGTFHIGRRLTLDP